MLLAQDLVLVVDDKVRCFSSKTMKNKIHRKAGSFDFCLIAVNTGKKGCVLCHAKLRAESTHREATSPERDIWNVGCSISGWEVALVQRKKQPYQGVWALSGSHLNREDTSLEAAAQPTLIYL